MNKGRLFFRGFILLLILGSLWSCKKPQEAHYNLPDQVSFNFDIQPILSNNCFVCHGPDSSSRQAGLRLDQRETAIALLESGHRAINPGKSGNSEILKRISSTDADFMMPPPEANKSLSPREIALIEKWIDQGAEWEPYWAFVPVNNPEVPEVNVQHALFNEIDNFVVDKLEAQQLSRVDLADNRSLMRRLSYALTGLPPDPTLVDNYARDPSKENYHQIVDELLDSPRFGEHWARHWMDLVRYADTRGHEFDYEIIGAWRYRDYLIRAFNEDLPYDQLILEHLAGDLLTDPRLNPQEKFNESVLGTAFYCLTEGKHSPVDLWEDEAIRIDNIIDVTSKTFQALTVACARCHDHKFDNIPTTDYYALYGILKSTRFTLIPAGINEHKLELLDSVKSEWSDLRNFIANELDLEGESDPITSEAMVPVATGSKLQMIGDFRQGDLQSWYASGIAFGNALGQPVIKGSRLVGLEPGKASSKVYGKGLQGALRSPDFVISHDSILVKAAGKHSEARVIIDNFQLIQDPIYGDLRIHTENEDMAAYAIDVSMWKGHTAYIELQVGNYGQKPGKGFHSYNIEPDAWLEVAYVYAYDSTVSIPELEAPVVDLQMSWQNWQKDRATFTEVAALDQYLQNKRPFIASLDQKIQKPLRSVQSLYDSVYLAGVTAGEPIHSSVFIRGNFRKHSKYKVPHRFFTALSDTTEGFDPKMPSRLALAQKIIDPNNPLTARVMVNRIWHHVFGRGLVETVDNFGLQGKPPTHPQLLDYLAWKFMNEGWSVKGMIRYLVQSYAFQQATQPYGEAQSADPENLLWHHYPVRRLGAESIRDAILYTSGRLDNTMYGPPVPIYLTEFLKGRGRPSQSGPLDGAGRRSVYQRLMRNFLPPMMLAFDMPVPFSTFGKRNSSNVPAQSLTLMNDPFVAEQSRYWAEQLLNQPLSFEERIHQIYVKAFSRPPDAAELQQARDFFEIQGGILASEDQSELSLWEEYCHTVFNMKEFIFLI